MKPYIKNGVDYSQSKNCAVCGVKYFKKVLTNKTIWGKSKFCSWKCHSKWQIGKPHPFNRRKMTKEEILHRFSVNPKWGGYMTGKKHSEASKIKMSISRLKIKPEEWTGYKTSEDRHLRRYFQNTIQKMVFERDNYTCQICHKMGCCLQVDHIKPWSRYPEFRFEMNNLRTLCMDCHYFVTFGKEKPKSIKAWGHNLNMVGV